MKNGQKLNNDWQTPLLQSKNKWLPPLIFKASYSGQQCKEQSSPAEFSRKLLLFLHFLHKILEFTELVPWTEVSTESISLQKL